MNEGSSVRSEKLADIEATWGPPAKIEQTGDGVIWYYYFYKTQKAGMNNGIGIKRGPGWWLSSIIADNEGNIIKVSTHWEQSNALNGH